FVGADGAGFGSFGAVAQGDAGNTHHGRFFGDATGVGDDAFRVFYQVVEFRVAHRTGEDKAFRVDAKGFHVFLCTRMSWKDYGNARLHRGENGGKLLFPVDVRRAVEGQDKIVSGRKVLFIPDSAFLQPVHVLLQGVDHGVADE